MPGFGFGFGSLSRKSAGGFNPPGAFQIPSITPSQAWDGTPGSGFTSVPADPARVTAKPALRAITPPNQFYTDSLTIGFAAMANNGGSMLENLGLEKVIVHLEGSVVEIDAPSFHSFTDANGNDVTYFGWWATLEHGGSHGAVHLYAEAVPIDSNMQNRIMGPFAYFPNDVIHDLEIEVAASAPEIAGQRYQTLANAFVYLRATGYRNPRVTITEAGLYNTAVIGGKSMFDGYVTIEASVPVEIGKPDSVTELESIIGLRTNIDGLHLKGANITVQAKNTNGFYHEGLERQHWFDGITYADSRPRYFLHRKGTKITNALSRNHPYLTELTTERLNDVANGASLVRGCTFREGFRDIVSAATCVIDNVIEDWTSHEFRTQDPALSVHYTGPANTATLTMSGGNDAGNRVLTAKEDGATVSTFAVQNSEQAYLDDTNYTVANVVDWLNSLIGWDAALLNDTRRATALSVSGSNGGQFIDADVTLPLTLVAWFDHHSDFWQNSPDAVENIIIAGNSCHHLGTQNIHMNVFAMRDTFWINNAFQLWEEDDGFGVLASQIGASASHVVVAHNTLSNQSMILRTDSTDNRHYDPDAYCLTSNNSFQQILWANVAEADADLAILDNHLHAGATIPVGSSGTSASGSADDLYVDAANGNFAPAGALQTNKKPPIVRFDKDGQKRSGQAAAGAVA